MSNIEKFDRLVEAEKIRQKISDEEMQRLSPTICRINELIIKVRENGGKPDHVAFSLSAWDSLLDTMLKPSSWPWLKLDRILGMKVKVSPYLQDGQIIVYEEGTIDDPLWIDRL